MDGLREAWDVVVIVWHVAPVVFAAACLVLGVVVVLVAAVIVADLRDDRRSADRAPALAAGAELRDPAGAADMVDQDDELDGNRTTHGVADGAADGPAGELVEAR